MRLPCKVAVECGLVPIDISTKRDFNPVYRANWCIFIQVRRLFTTKTPLLIEIFTPIVMAPLKVKESRILIFLIPIGEIND